MGVDPNGGAIGAVGAYSSLADNPNFVHPLTAAVGGGCAFSTVDVKHLGE